MSIRTGLISAGAAVAMLLLTGAAVSAQGECQDCDLGPTGYHSFNGDGGPATCLSWSEGGSDCHASAKTGHCVGGDPTTHYSGCGQQNDSELASALQRGSTLRTVLLLQSRVMRGDGMVRWNAARAAFQVYSCDQVTVVAHVPFAPAIVAVGL